MQSAFLCLSQNQSIKKLKENVTATISNSLPLLIPSTPTPVTNIQDPHFYFHSTFHFPDLEAEQRQPAFNGENISALPLHPGSQSILDVSQLLRTHLLSYKASKN